MEFTVVRSPEEGVPYLNRLKNAGLLAVDTETTGLDAHRDQLRLVQIGAAGMPVLLIDCVPFLEDSRGRAFLKEVLEGDSGKIFHNAKFDLQFLRGEGILPENIRDTMLAAELLRPCGGPRKVNLAAVASHYLGVSLDKTEQTGDWSGALSDSQLAYAASDSRILLQLWDCLAGSERTAWNGLPISNLPVRRLWPGRSMTGFPWIWGNGNIYVQIYRINMRWHCRRFMLTAESLPIS